MRDVLANRVYVTLFGAQVIALLGAGLLTVGLALLAYDLAGDQAGLVLGTALTIKMIAYVTVSPVMAALTSRVSRTHVLFWASGVRAAVALTLPLISDTWQIYLLIFVLQAASATFTPAFQALIPEVLPEESQYTQALSLSRLAYDLEAVFSPVLAATLLIVLSPSDLFVVTFVGFAISAGLVLVVRLPAVRGAPDRPFRRRLTRGVRMFRNVEELRGLLALNVSVALCGAMVIVNTVVLVRGQLGRVEGDVAVLLAAFGAGSMLIAVLMPRVLRVVVDRTVMLAGAALGPLGLGGAALVIAWFGETAQWVGLIATWGVLGMASSLVMTPSARLLRRVTANNDRGAVFAAQFSLSHACFMVTYPLAGVLGATVGLSVTALVLGAAGLVAGLLAARLWTTTSASFRGAASGVGVPGSRG